MIEIPIMACSVNKYYRSWQGRVLISKDGREFKKEVDLLLNNYEKVLGKIKLTLILHFKDKRKRDLDNYNKVLIDCLKNKLFEDDDQIYQLYMEKYIGCGFNKISIDIESIDIESPVNEKIKEKKKNDIEINKKNTEENTEEIKVEKNIKRKTKKPKTLKKTVIDMIN
jgi:crossover junction endodeoxyribonuclease RusA